MNILILAITAWWIAEGSFIIQNLKFLFKVNRIFVFDCAKCLGFWLGMFVDFRLSTIELFVNFDPVKAVLVSFFAIILTKINLRYL